MTRLAACAVALVVVAAVLGCHGRQPETAAAKVGAAALTVPGGWQRQLPATEEDRQVWSPTPAKNAAKETLAVRVAKRRPQMSVDDILTAASSAQGVLRDVSVLESRRFTTEQGLEALWVETSFTPRGSSSSYRRAHVTAIGKEHVFHVFYTALAPDPDTRVLRTAVDSLREEG